MLELKEWVYFLVFREKDSGDLDRTEEIGLDIFLERYKAEAMREERERHPHI